MSRVIKLMKTRGHIVIFYRAICNGHRRIGSHFIRATVNRKKTMIHQNRFFVSLSFSVCAVILLDPLNFQPFYKSSVIVYSTAGNGTTASYNHSESASFGACLL